MGETFFSSLRDLLSIQRWNFVPRIEDWSEAENIAYYTHMTYALSKKLGINEAEISKALHRCLLKSFNKHYLSDIPIHAREAIKKNNMPLWISLIESAADITSKLFPKEIRNDIRDYMLHESAIKANLEKTEEIIDFCQYKTALEECENNIQVYKDLNSKKKEEEILFKIGKLDSYKSYESHINEMNYYLAHIKSLKYIRRWNRLNRNIQSSVMAHTFIVTILALVFSMLEKEKNKADDFVYQCILKALFHDVPECITGDIITPVKEIIKNQEKGTWDKIEEAMLKEFKEKIPEQVLMDNEKYKLFENDKNNENFTVDSLVKECDKLALVLECAFEKKRYDAKDEMAIAYTKYIDDLMKSEWPRVREYTNLVLIEYSK